MWECKRCGSVDLERRNKKGYEDYTYRCCGCGNSSTVLNLLASWTPDCQMDYDYVAVSSDTIDMSLGKN